MQHCLLDTRCSEGVPHVAGRAVARPGLALEEGLGLLGLPRRQRAQQRAELLAARALRLPPPRRAQRPHRLPPHPARRRSRVLGSRRRIHAVRHILVRQRKVRRVIWNKQPFAPKTSNLKKINVTAEWKINDRLPRSMALGVAHWPQWAPLGDCALRELFNNANELTALHYVQCGPSGATYF